jgi:hypothetical protein
MFVSVPASFVVLFVVGHFFLFCNVFRIARGLELTWGGLFVALATATLASGYPGWYATSAISIAMTTAVIAFEMRKPSYHGVFWQRVNPQLPEWWRANSNCNAGVGITAEFAESAEEEGRKETKSDTA